MAGRGSNGAKGGMTPTVVMAVAVAVLALPSAVLAFSSRLDVPGAGLGAGTAGFAPGEIDPRLARALAARPPGKGPLFRFTPAGLATRPDRSVTVAVRVDSASAQAIIVRASSAALAGQRPLASATLPLRIAPTAYSLGLSRGYEGFAPGGVSGFNLSSDSGRRAEIPSLNGEASADSVSDPASARLAPHITLNERDRAGRAPRTLESMGEQSVDVGGSYRLTRNLDVTAGVRYSQDRDRIKPLTDAKSDNQAVFVGTQFRF